jgi:hypothetical protein
MPFKPGQSGNPAGKPPGSSSLKTKIQQQFLEMMAKQVQHNGETKTFLDAYNETFIQDSLTPGSVAYKFLAERMYGMEILSDIEASVSRSKREDRDFAMYRVHLRGFDIQQRILASHSRDIGLMAGRRAGKSETNKLKAISQAVSAPKQRVLIIGLTIMKTVHIYQDDMVRILSELGFDFVNKSTDNIITLGNDSFIQFGGNSNRMEREKYRGQHYDLIIVDEAQSQPELGMMVREILEPMLMDTNGQLMLTGSGPRTRGTFWEQYYNNPTPSGLRLNWNLSSNPHIYNYTEALAILREKNGLEETDPLYMREYLGLVVYDDDALVYRMRDDNYYTDQSMLDWMAQQSPEDIRFVGGLDFGFRDSDAFVIVMYSEKANEKFVVYEYKQAGTDVTTLCDAIKSGKEYIKTSALFNGSYHRDFDIFADTSDQKISMELSQRYGIPVYNAVKYDKPLAVQMLQEEVRRGTFRIKKGSLFDEEALRIIFKRLEQEGQPSIITREIDDEVYHPDLMDAILYSLRNYWMMHSQDHFVAKPTAPLMQDADNFVEQYNSRTKEQLF